MLTTVVGFNFGRGVISAYFDYEESFCSTNEKFKIEHTVSPKKSTYSQRSQLGILVSFSLGQRGKTLLMVILLHWFKKGCINQISNDLRSPVLDVV